MGTATIIIIAVVLLFLFSGLFVVKQQTAAIVERFGRFLSIRQSGLHFKIPFIDRISGRISLRILQLDVIVETKTKDDVFVKLKVSVQYKVVQEKVYDAFYKLDYPQDQITSYVFDVVRASMDYFLFLWDFWISNFLLPRSTYLFRSNRYMDRLAFRTYGFCCSSLYSV